MFRRHAVVSVLIFVASSGALGQSRSKAKAAPVAPPPGAEVAVLQTQLREQRALLLWMLQSDVRRGEALLKAFEQQTPLPPIESFDRPESDSEAKKPEPSETKKAEPAKPFRKAAVDVGTISGKVIFEGRPSDDAYVYIDNLTAAPVRNKAVEIKQKDKQFWPRVVVVQRGARVTFPNFDSVFHNVFSVSPGNTFDLGNYQAGDQPKSVTLLHPGVVEVFCNIHSRMSASVLVVPNRYFAKVKQDGSFRLEGVPVGTREVVAWEPSSTPSLKSVEVTTDGAAVELTLQVADRPAHTNKLGQSYGSYGD